VSKRIDAGDVVGAGGGGGGNGQQRREVHNRSSEGVGFNPTPPTMAGLPRVV